METTRSSRRRFASALALAGGAAVVGCTRPRTGREEERGGATGAAKPEGSREERARAEGSAIITPGEDLMREHGVLERVLVVWAEAEEPLRRGADVDVEALRSSIDLVQRFVERYHERIEEELVFPRLEEAGRHRELAATLRDQHEVGRGITAEVAALLERGLDERSRARVADRLAAYRRMYGAHASREDTVAFPAFRELVGERYAELGEEFERREHEILGEGGFENAVATAEGIERAFGLEDLARFTPERSPA